MIFSPDEKPSPFGINPKATLKPVIFYVSGGFKMMNISAQLKC
ncbi:hypothetical protein CF65_01721 [Aggregatibacter actinomycetemcomitans HK1651]|nr:hypothetical protein CF65_01721 [Aggregatibacter actinomycetemcomitans HK1651]